MENSQPNRLSSAPARKRRSSILKAVRSHRTPFSELELQVATPTEPARSRRVSFSRRTGVAEFVTHEATTTWKNFYEEQNKTLESSGNDSELKNPSASNRIFQFQEVEMEVVEALGSARCLNGPFNNVNLTNQFVALDETDRYTVNAPKRHFDQSAFTENRSDVFKTNNTDGVEPSGNIPLDFSALQTIGSTDLDEIKMDIGRRAKSKEDRNISQFVEVDLNVTQAGHLNGEFDMSITDTVLSPKREVSNDSALRAGARLPTVSGDWLADKENVVVNPYVAPNESEIFATDSIKEKVLVFNGKNLKYANIDDDLDDLNDVVSKKSSKISTSDRNNCSLTVPRDRIEDISLAIGVAKVVQKPRRTILHEQSDLNMTKAALVHLNCNDAETGEIKIGKKNTTIFSKDALLDMSITQSLPSSLVYKRNTHDGQQMDMSLIETEPISSKSKTIYPTNQDISLTECIQSIVPPKETGDIIQQHRKRNTILFDKDNEDGDISITQCIPSTAISRPNSEVQRDPKRNTILFDKDNEDGDISITQCIPSTAISRLNSEVQRDPKRNTILFDKDNEDGDISITQCIPSTAIYRIRSEVQRDPKRNTILLDKDNKDGDISVTQCVTSSAVSKIQSEVQRDPKRNTILFDKDNKDGDISVTQCIPSSAVSKIQIEVQRDPKRNTILLDKDNKDGDISVTQCIPSSAVSKIQIEVQTNPKRNTILFDKDNEDGNISVTQCIQSSAVSKIQIEVQRDPKRNTILFDKDNKDGDISVTQCIPSSEVSKIQIEVQRDPKRNTILFDKDNKDGDISVTQCIPSSEVSKIQIEVQRDPKRNTILFDKDNKDGDISVTQCIPSCAVSKIQIEVQRDPKRNTILFDKDNEDGDISVTQCITSSAVSKIQSEVQRDPKRNTILFDKDNKDGDISVTQCISNFAVSKIKTEVQRDPKRNTILFDKSNKDGDISITQCIPTSEVFEIKSEVQRDPKRNTILFDKSNKDGDISITQCIPTPEVFEIKSEVQKDPKRNTILFDKYNEGDLSIIQCVPAKVIEHNSESDEAKLDMELTMGLQGNQNKSNILHTANNEECDMSLTETLHTKVPCDDTGVSVTRQVLETIHSNKLLDLIQETEKDTSSPTYSIRQLDSQTDSTESDKLSAEMHLTQNVVCAPIHVTYRCEESVHSVARDRTATWANNVSDTPAETKVSDEEVDLDNISQEYSTPLDCEYESKPLKPSSSLVNELLAMSDESVRDNAIGDLCDANKSVHTGSVDTQEFCSALKRKLTDVADDNSRGSSSKNRHIENVVCPESGTEETCSKDDTNDLLERLSEFTGTVDTTRRISVQPRKSTALSYHDLFNNISMAQAMLHRSTSTELADDSCVTNTSVNEDTRASVSRDVIKTLNFEDDPVEMSPLRKNAFGEKSPVRDTKTIPGYMSDVPQGLKELMMDLVKPMADTRAKIGRNTSSCSVQIQANLTTSSQVDINISTAPEECATHISDLAAGAVERALATRVSPVLVEGPEPRLPSVEDQVLTFDQFNPLNNILLRPTGPTDMRRPDYVEPEPLPSTATRGPLHQDQTSQERVPESPVITVYEPEPLPSTAARGPLHRDQTSQHSEINSDKTSDTPSETRSADCTADVRIVEMRDTEVNTLVAMKENKELLNANSALTINDDEKKSKATKRNRQSTPRRHGKLNKYLSGLKIKVARKSPEGKREKLEENQHTESPSSPSQPAITIQQLTTHYDIEDLAQNTMEATDSDERSSEPPSPIGSFTSSKRNQSSDSAPVTPKRLDFASEIRDQIDAMPFMGRPECEWESRGDGGARDEDGVWWWFRLLHSHLRLGMRLVERDARPKLAEVVLHTDLKGCRDPVVSLAAKLAAEAAREAAAAAVTGSGQAPALVRRCAAVARLAAQWARSLHDARLRLACRVDEGGALAFSCANVPLRCVWEVRFQVELAPAEGGGLPWPRAGSPTLRLAQPAAAAGAVSAEQLRSEMRAVAHDWGHVPICIWRIFRLLKNKTLDDEPLKGF